MQKNNFNKGWDFSLGNLSAETREWEKVDLPHDYSIGQSPNPNSLSGRVGGFFPCGLGNYMKSFNVPFEWTGKKIFIEFEGIYMNAEVSLNGNILGRHLYGYTGFYFDMTKYVIFGGQNELKVVVENSTIPNSRWYSGSGIYRNVWIYTADELHIKNWGVNVTTNNISRDKADIEIATEIEGYCTSKDILIKSSISDAKGKVVAVSEIKADNILILTDIILPTPLLWDIDNPYLYTLLTEIINDGVVTDAHTTNFGVRSISVDSRNGFQLNGRTVKMKGGCVHHDNGILGAASYYRSEERKVELLKASGYNAIRCAHNPPSPSFLDACDRLGMLVIVEAFDCWKQAKTQFDYHLWFADWWERDIDSMVLCGRIHPSVVIWSIGNEICEQLGGSDAYNTSKALSSRIRVLDATRPIMLAAAPIITDDLTILANPSPYDDWRRLDCIFEPLDIAGYNYSFTRYEADHKLFPERVIVGAESVPKHSYENWSLVEKLPYVIGDFVWTAIDYLGEAGIGQVYYREERTDIKEKHEDFPWIKAYCGDIDTCGFKRSQSYYRDILWGVSDIPHIAVRMPVAEHLKTEITTFWGWNDNVSSWNFKGFEGKSLLVDVYSCGENVELFLNDKSLGKRSLYRDDNLKEENGGFDDPSIQMKRYAAIFEVPYEAGELKAVADNGKMFIIKTTGAPYEIKLTADRRCIGSDSDLSYVTVEIVDKEGNSVADSFNNVSFNISGNGVLLAVGNSNPKSTQINTGRQYDAYRGRLMAVIKSIGAGSIILKANADQLLGAEIMITAEDPL